MADDDPVHYEVRDAVALLTLDRPKALNAINQALSVALGRGLARAEADDAVRAIVLTGRGRAFSAGADLKAVAAGEAIVDPEHPEWGIGGWARHRAAKPTIAAVNGLALGGGCELVLACDLAIADEDAVLGLPEVTRGLVAGAGGLIRLPQQVPRRIALEIALTGEPISAARAAEIGLVNRVVAAGTALDAARATASAIAANAPMAVRESKALMHRAAHTDGWGEEIWADNDAVLGAVFSSADAREGARAFGEKRAPVWQDY